MANRSSRATRANRANRATGHLDPTAALARKASEAEHLREFIDRTTFSGDQREASGELSAVDQHPADSADQTMQREVDYTIKGIVADEVQQVQAALKRQAEGRYGLCESCGQEIDPARLAVRPHATLCIDCQRVADGEVRSF
ncbi:MAG: TraR/DksA C4-type zinc finger protein [Chloroflexi bacterium]|nr:TraR/DksA C4-type zinc finger protein [Chloroflexota bacterium]